MLAHRYGLDPLDDARDLRVGQQFCGKWTLEELLGTGASGAVYAARHRNGHRVAIKVVWSKWAALPEMRERFLNEARASNLVEHRGAVRIHDEGVTEDGSIFLVMDLLQGQTLQEYGALHGTLSADQALLVADELLDILAAAHKAGVLHRDIKPGNIFLNWDGRLVLVDFGVARLSESRFPTRTGVPIGTPSFMPPEQAAGRWAEVDARSDLWSLGATLFTLLTGQTVRQTASLEEELRAAIAGPVRSLGAARSLPQPVVDLVDRALAPEPEARFRSALDMREAVRAALTALGVALPTASELPGVRARLTTPARKKSKPADRHSSAVRRKLSDVTLIAPSEAEQWAQAARSRKSRVSIALASLALGAGVLALGPFGLGPVTLEDVASWHFVAPPQLLREETGVLSRGHTALSRVVTSGAAEQAVQVQAHATRARLKAVALALESAPDVRPEVRPPRPKRRPARKVETEPVPPPVEPEPFDPLEARL